MWTVTIVFLTFLVKQLVSSTFLSDGVLTVNFTKIQDESEENNEYNFEWAQTFYGNIITLFLCLKFNIFFRCSLDDGNTFHGRTFLLDVDHTIYILFGANNTFYWVEFTESEYANENQITKTVRMGKLFNI